MLQKNWNGSSEDWLHGDEHLDDEESYAPMEQWEIDEAVGWFSLIYDNGSEGDPMICMSDMSSNPICEAIYNRVQRILEEQEL